MAETKSNRGVKQDEVVLDDFEKEVRKMIE